MQCKTAIITNVLPTANNTSKTIRKRARIKVGRFITHSAHVLRTYMDLVVQSRPGPAKLLCSNYLMVCNRSTLLFQLLVGDIHSMKFELPCC